MEVRLGSLGCTAKPDAWHPLTMLLEAHARTWAHLIRASWPWGILLSALWACRSHHTALLFVKRGKPASRL